MSEELQEVKWYSLVGYKDAKIFIRDNINAAARSFVTTGYYLKHIRDKELYKEDSYSSIWDLAQAEFGISKSEASKFMSINDKFSKDGNSPILLDQYKDFSKSKLEEMLYLSAEQLEQVTAGTTVVQIREIKNPEKTVSTSKQNQLPEPLSILGLPVTVYPPNSMLDTKGCGHKYDCFSCHRDGCNIRQEDCWCIDAPCGNSFPCGILKQEMTAIKHSVGDSCQFVNLDLVGPEHIRAGDKEPTPCCKYCKNPCGYICQRVAKQTLKPEPESDTHAPAHVEQLKCDIRDQIILSGEKGLTCSGFELEQCNDCDKYDPPAIPRLELIDDLDFNVRTYNCLKRAGIDTVEKLCSMTEGGASQIRNISAKCLTEIKEKLAEIGLTLKSDDNPASPISAEKSDFPCDTCGHDIKGCCNYDDESDWCELGSAWIPKASRLENTTETMKCDTCGFEEDGHCEYPDADENPCLVGEKWIQKDEESEQVEIVEAEIVQMVPEEWLKPIYSAEYHLREAIAREEEQLEVMRDSWKMHQPDTLLKHETVLTALKCHLTELEYANLQIANRIQPELPILKNNDQRKEFIEAYTTWPIWINLEQTGERYYRYDLSDKVAMVVKVSKKHKWNGWQEAKEISYNAEQYYLLGIKTEYGLKGSKFTEDSSRTFCECNTNMTVLTDYLKDFQKKGV